MTLTRAEIDRTAKGLLIVSIFGIIALVGFKLFAPDQLMPVVYMAFVYVAITIPYALYLIYRDRKLMAEADE